MEGGSGKGAVPFHLAHWYPPTIRDIGLGEDGGALALNTSSRKLFERSKLKFEVELL
jgi:hypothetical protein